ncbi:DUF6518 family protein [Streptomyces hokutonensis]|uniref:DUF6518 family protein n=1 Tax=Streptomyces hokutonensis TaxID=1306990 RepID=UPI0038077B78
MGLMLPAGVSPLMTLEGLAGMTATQQRPNLSTLHGQRIAVGIAASLAVGTGLGVLTNLAQGWLPGSWNQLANSGTVWSAVAFVAGALLATWGTAAAAAAGLAAEVGLVVGYYGYAEFGRSGMGALAPVVVWLVMAFVAGPLFGAVGAWWRCGTTSRRITGGAAVAGVVGTEGIHYSFVLHYMPPAFACWILMIALSLVLGRTNRERVMTLLTALPMSLLAYAIIYVGFLGALL